jgi:site-specific DNA-methyltransferase (adenine-specific)
MSDRWAVHHGDCREVMRTLDPESIDSIVTDPPYALGFMGKGWDTYSTGRKQKHNNRFEEFIYDVCEHAFRVAKPGAHLLAFGGTRTYHRLACAIEDAGWDIRDCVMWVYGSGFPKSHDVSKAIDREAGAEREVVGSKLGQPGYSLTDGKGGLYGGGFGANGTGEGECAITAPATEAAKQWQGWGTALKPAYEPIIVARKPLRGTVAGNVLEWGTGGINVDGCRVGRDTYDVSGWSQTGSKASENRAMSGGNYARDAKPDAEGRWPANFIHDGSEEVVGLFPETKSGTGGQPQTAQRRGTSELVGLSSSGTKVGHDDSGSAARFFYCAKASKRDRDEGCEGMPTIRVKMNNGNDAAGDPVSDRFTKMARNHHPTVKPTDLMRYLCRLVTPPDGLVLDPFSGSGSTGKAAMLEGFRFVGCELSAEYIEIARARIGHAAGQSRQKELALA